MLTQDWHLVIMLIASRWTSAVAGAAEAGLSLRKQLCKAASTWAPSAP